MKKSANEKEEKTQTNLRFLIYLFIYFFTLDTRLNAAHERLGGNVGTLQLDDAPYARCPIIQRFSLSRTCLHPVDLQSSTYQNN